MADNVAVAAGVEVAANVDVAANAEVPADVEVAAEVEEIDIAGLFMDAFERLTIEERKLKLLEKAKSLQTKIQELLAHNQYQDKVKEISKILPEDVEPGEVRFRRITGLMGLMCEIAIVHGRSFAGFHWVDQDNQFKQVKPFVHEVTVLWMASCYDAESDSIILFDKEEYILESFILAGLEDIAEDIIKFSATFHRMKINATELSFLYMLSMFDKERPELTPAAQETIGFCRDEYLRSFEDYMVAEYESNGLGRMVELIEMLSKSQTIGNKLRDVINLKYKDKNYTLLFRQIWLHIENAVVEPEVEPQVEPEVEPVPA